MCDRVCLFVVQRRRISCVFEKVIEALKFNSRPWPEDLCAAVVYTVLCNICPSVRPVDVCVVCVCVCACNFM